MSTNRHLALVENEAQPIEKVEYVPTVAQTLDQAAYNLNQIYALAKKVMRHKVDYDTIPGTQKPSLLKPGAERLLQFFGLGHNVECVNKIEDWENGFFFYHYKVAIIHPNYPDFVVAECEGSCNSKESKYRKHDPYSVVNTLQKMAIKRALVGATLQATGSSGLFTQDVEDMGFNNDLPKPNQPKSYDNVSSVDRPASEKQVKKFIFEAEKRGLSDKLQKALIDYMYKKQSRKDLTGKEASSLIKMMMESTNEELNEVFKAIKAHHQSVKESSRREVIDVDPETGEVKSSGPITEDEINKALGL